MRCFRPNRSEEIGEITKALAKVQAELKNPVPNRVSHFAKRGKNGVAEPDYADLDAIEDLLRGPCGKHGLSHNAELYREGNVRVLSLCVAHDESGQYRTTEVDVPNDVKPQEFMAALTYYRRGLLCAFFGIAADRDDDGTTAEAAAVRSQAERADKFKKAMVKAWEKCESDEDRENWKERAKAPVKEGLVSQQWVDELTAAKA